MFSVNYIFIIGAVLVSAFGQVIFKYAAQHLRLSPTGTYLEILKENLIPASLVSLALALYIVSTIVWVKALQSVPLSIAFLFYSLAFIIVPVAGFVLFGEPIPRFFLPGLALIIGGIVLITYG